jgi:hypothetical protein
MRRILPYLALALVGLALATSVSVWYFVHETNAGLCGQCPSWGMTCQLNDATHSYYCSYDAASPCTPEQLAGGEWKDGICSACGRMRNGEITTAQLCRINRGTGIFACLSPSGGLVLSGPHAP